ncbi:MAG: hypothetical protein ABIL20_09310 [candidate division WOR-3 bacterium]
MNRTFIYYLAITLVAVSCARKEEVHLFVDGGPEVIYDFPIFSDSLCLACAQIGLKISTDPKFETLMVIVNNDTLQPYSLDHYCAYYQDSITPECIQYNLQIDSDVGTASAGCQMPEPFKIIKPRQPIAPNSDCELIWQKSKNAQMYTVWIYAFWGSCTVDTMLQTADTSITISGDFLNGDYIEISISAINGTKLDDEHGNVKGNAIGYWLGKLTVTEFIDILKN